MSDCEDHIAFSINSSKNIGNGTSEWKAYQNLCKMKEVGLLDPHFHSAFERLHQRFQKWSHNFIPHPTLRLSWNAFWDIRPSKPRENPVSYTDIDSYVRLMRIDLLPEEVRMVMMFDRFYYKHSNNEKTGK